MKKSQRQHAEGAAAVTADEPSTPLAARPAGLQQTTPSSPVVSPDAVASATATAVARARLLKRQAPAAEAPAGAEGEGSHVHHALLHKFGSDAGLMGVAEAAGACTGQLLSALPHVAQWRQEVMAVRLVAGLTLGLVVGYALLFAPARLGWWNEAHLVATFGAHNALVFSLFNLLGFFPAILGCVAWPVLRSERRKVKLWRFIAASLGAGAFSLLSYLAVWEPPRPGRAQKLPPQHLAGRARWLQRAYESRLWPAILLMNSLWFLSFTLVVSPATWAQFGYLATHSFTIHIMLLDFALLTLMSPWLVIRDATARAWGPAKTQRGRVMLGLAMVLTPVIGPGVYLLLRPVSRAGGVLRPGWFSSAAKTLQAAATHPFKYPMGVIHGLRGGPEIAEQQQHASRPAGSANGSSMQGLTNRRTAGAVAGAARGGLAAQVAEAAAVPLPSNIQASVGAAVQLASDWCRDSWRWMGTQAARLRGGGTPVASSDDAAGDELDVNGTDGGVSDYTPGLLNKVPFDNLFSSQQRHEQGPWPLGPSPAPIKARDATLGYGEVYLFGNDYDEYEFDFDQETSSDLDDVSVEDYPSGDDSSPEESSEDRDDISEHDESSEGGTSSEADGFEVHGDVPGVGGSPSASRGSREAKGVAMKLLEELAQQAHPRLASQGRTTVL